MDAEIDRILALEALEEGVTMRWLSTVAHADEGTLRIAYEIDYDYCKGCGICAAECPCGAIAMMPEET